MESSSLFRHPSNAMMASIILSGIIISLGICLESVSLFLARKKVKLGVRAIFGMGHVLALLLHARVARYINESYTSYTSNNNFGYSNAEKAVFRAENWRVLMVLFSRGLLALVIHIHLKDSKYEPIPLIVCSVLGHTTLAENVLYVQAFWSPGQVKFPKGNIPRSMSGRLL
jgi:hypothetical protein